jgi:histidinol-phosphatase
VPEARREAADPPPDLSLALELADAADRITTRWFLAGELVVEAKPDRTPVTEADRAVERMVRDRLAGHRPADAVLGEEFGARPPGGAQDPNQPRRWIVDPVDGTKNFVRGVPVWATLLALEEHGRLTVGVVSAPALRRRWWAWSGGGAWTSTAGGALRRCRVSRVGELADAHLSYSSLSGWEVRGSLAGFLELCRKAWRTRAFGDFLSHVLVAEGAVDAAFEPEVSLWDLAALQVIVEEAGGRLTDLDGNPHADGGSVLTSNGLLHEAVLAHLRQRPGGGGGG